MCYFINVLGVVDKVRNGVAKIKQNITTQESTNNLNFK